MQCFYDLTRSLTQTNQERHGVQDFQISLRTLKRKTAPNKKVEFASEMNRLVSGGE